MVESHATKPSEEEKAIPQPSFLDMGSFLPLTSIKSPQTFSGVSNGHSGSSKLRANQSVNTATAFSNPQQPFYSKVLNKLHTQKQVTTE